MGVNKLYNLYRAGKEAFKKQKTYGTGAVTSTSIGKNLTKKRRIQDESVAFTDKLHKGFSTETKNKLKQKNPLYKFKQKMSKIVDKKD